MKKNSSKKINRQLIDPKLINTTKTYTEVERPKLQYLDNPDKVVVAVSKIPGARKDKGYLKVFARAFLAMQQLKIGSIQLLCIILQTYESDSTCFNESIFRFNYKIAQSEGYSKSETVYYDALKQLKELDIIIKYHESGWINLNLTMFFKGDRPKYIEDNEQLLLAEIEREEQKTIALAPGEQEQSRASCPMKQVIQINDPGNNPSFYIPNSVRYQHDSTILAPSNT